MRREERKRQRSMMRNVMIDGGGRAEKEKEKDNMVYHPFRSARMVISTF